MFRAKPNVDRASTEYLLPQNYEKRPKWLRKFVLSYRSAEHSAAGQNRPTGALLQVAEAARLARNAWSIPVLSRRTSRAALALAPWPALKCDRMLRNAKVCLGAGATARASRQTLPNPAALCEN
jgi:hypothetical protein